jgi:hypothetical protein
MKQVKVEEDVENPMKQRTGDMKNDESIVLAMRLDKTRKAILYGSRLAEAGSAFE